MDSLLHEITNYLRNNADGKRLKVEADVPDEMVEKVVCTVLPEISKGMTSGKHLEGVLQVYDKNQSNPQSLLNAEKGFDTRQLESEGNQLLNTILDGNSANDVAKHAANKLSADGISAGSIQTMLPMVAALATKFLGQNLSQQTGLNQLHGQGGAVSQLLGKFLDADNDGSYVDDLGDMAMNLVKKVVGGDKN